MEKIKLIVKLGEENQRIDAFIAEKIAGFSKRKAKSLIDRGLVVLNNKSLKLASAIVHRGDNILVHVPHDPPLDNKLIQISDDDIIYDSGKFVVVNKPPGLASQEMKDPTKQHLIRCVQEYYMRKGIKLKEPLILVHRLDLETSGALFLAKNSEIATWATQQFRERKVFKKYLAISHGLSHKDSFRCDAHLSEIDKKTGNVRVVLSGGKSAQTEFQVLSQNVEARMTLFACFPKTGRSHQIRVHLEHCGFPILGDKRYGHERRRLLPSSFRRVEELSFKAHCLHSLELNFEREYEERKLQFKAPLPNHYSEIMRELFPGVSL